MRISLTAWDRLLSNVMLYTATPCYFASGSAEESPRGRHGPDQSLKGHHH